MPNSGRSHAFSKYQMKSSFPFNALRIFDVVARHLNIVHAAHELHTTQSSVSRHIQNLEQALGVELFLRGSRGLKFTEAGDTLFVHTQRMFADLYAVTEQLSGRKTRQTLRIAVARSYATRVLSKHVNDFCAAYPWIDLHLDGTRHLADLHRGEADAAIRVGEGDWPDLNAECLGDEYLSPVCSPELAGSRGPLKEPGDLQSFTLLHYSEQQQWHTWLAAVGNSSIDATKGITFTETVMMLEAAEAGQGVAIARISLVRDELAKGSLVQPFSTCVPDQQQYYFCTTERGMHRSVVIAFRGWLLALNDRQRAG